MSSRLSKGVFFKLSPIILSIFFMSLGGQEAKAGALDWLKGKQSDRKAEIPQLREQPSKQEASTATPLPQFFQEEAQPDLTGKNLPIIKFVESHWTHSKKILETDTRTIDGKIQAKKCSDMLRKLFSIFVNDAKESLKSSAQAISSIEQGNHVTEDLINELNRIVTAPREETLSKLEATVLRIQALDDKQIQNIKSFMTTSDGLAALGAESFNTLELIPQMSITPLDIYVQAAKTLMKQIQSNAEAFKGLLLNAQAGTEQLNTNLELLVETIKSTLRFSDHFAFNQYPLINLPVPTREKLFAQVGNLKSTLKGIGNTLEIGSSQAKNAAQQYSNLVDAMNTKFKDALQYQTATDLASGNLPQISSYAQNQINGLYQRTREVVVEYRQKSMRAMRETAKAPPKVAVESSEERSERYASKAANEKLPLFLLGGAAPKVGEAFVPMRADNGKKGKTSVLFSETLTNVQPSPLRSHETDILEKELGSDIPYSDIAQGSSYHDFEAPVSLERKAEDGIAEFLNSPDSMPKQAAGYFQKRDEKKDFPVEAQDNDRQENEGQDLEISKMGSENFSSDNSEVLPVFRLDEPGKK
ncbi:MAG: hypothetical protein HQM08_14015 [Candidatus Riflebacteria bacterium]|nr:hypothetical protein [Candidatus Riflebacteria bacterium]